MHKCGYIHGDIRWPNVAYDENLQSYLLIDFENVEKIDNECSLHSEKDICIHCKCILRDFYYIRDHICNSDHLRKRTSDKKLIELLGKLIDILNIKEKKEWNETKKQKLFNLLK